MGPFVVSGLPLDSIALSTWEALLREGKTVDVESQCLGLVQALTLTSRVALGMSPTPLNLLWLL